MLALLADGESWSSSALALALGTSQRTVQRALDALAAAGKVQSFGRGRARRWMTPPLPGFTTTVVTPRAAADRLGSRHDIDQLPRSFASTAPSPAPSRCMASRTTASTSGSPPATS